MHVLITGGAGFIGSHLCDRFIGEGHTVTCIDNLITGCRRNIEPLEANPLFSYCEGDVSEVDLQRHVARPVHAILHFACPASPPEYIAHPEATIRACSSGTWRLLDLAREQGARFLLASTSEVYGDPHQHPQTETYWGHVNPIGVRSVYDESKRFAEMLTALYHRDYKTNTAIVRIFNTYGPRMKALDGRVIPNMVCQALRGEALSVYGDGSQTRSFCFYKDLVDGIVLLLKSDLHDPVNLGNSSEYTILQLANSIRGLVESPAPLLYKPLPPDDPTRRRPDITRARTFLGWEPRTSLDEGLRQTVTWFKTQLEVQRA